jgi:molybdenum cofactor synthesis domain-containing protein
MSRGTILHVCISPRKGTAKEAVQQAVLLEDRGLQGDAHAGSGHRQISLLNEADIEAMKAKGLSLQPGAFGENLVVRGIDLAVLGVGSRLRAGDAELEITQIGKLCHNPCAIHESAGECIMPRDGVFARVIKGGSVVPKLSIEVISEIPRQVIQASVLTVSDSCAAGTARDTAGPAVADALEKELQARVSWTGVVPDEKPLISDTLRSVAQRNFDLLVTTGGTGCGPRDVTPEATRAVMDREVPGLAEAMRTASFRKTPHALLQRGVCGICGSTLIVNLPGSRRGALENLTVILPALPHAVRLLRGQTAHPEGRI